MLTPSKKFDPLIKINIQNVVKKSVKKSKCCNCLQHFVKVYEHFVNVANIDSAKVYKML